MTKRFSAMLALAILVAYPAIGHGQQLQPSPAPGKYIPEVGPTPTPYASATPTPYASASGQHPQSAPLAVPIGGSRGVFTADLDYLLWFLANSTSTNTIATTNSLGSPGVIILGTVGAAEHAGREPTSGGRLKFGYWQVQDNPWIPSGVRDFGVEAVFFLVGERSVDFANSLTPNLVRPFFDLNNRIESGFVVAAPGFATGNINARAEASFWGAEANVWKNIFADCPGTTCTVDLMAGLRFLNADQTVTIGSTSVFSPALPPASPYFSFAGNRLDVLDSFATHNRFYGGQVGIAGKSWPLPKLCFEVDFKLALGVTVEEVSVAGSQFRTFANGTTASYNGGLLALPSNIGKFHENKFTQIPEVDFKVSYDVMRHVTISSTFTTLYWNNLARASQQVDREIDITQIPNYPLNAGAVPTGLGRPAVPFVQDDLWLLGVSFGLEVKW